MGAVLIVRVLGKVGGGFLIPGNLRVFLLEFLLCFLEKYLLVLLIYRFTFLAVCPALKPQGILYMSFKYGVFEGERNGRYFLDFTEEKLEQLLKKHTSLQQLRNFLTEDVTLQFEVYRHR